MTQLHHSQEGLRESATFGRDVIYEIQRRRAHRDLRYPRLGGQAPGAPFLTTWSFWARACRAIRWKATASAATPM